MKKVFYLLFLLLALASCEKPEEGMQPAPSSNAEIVRFRIYQNQNIFFDGIINDETATITVAIPEGIDKTGIRPEVLISAGARVTPASGARQDFTTPVEYTVVSENGERSQTYSVTVTNN